MYGLAVGVLCTVYWSNRCMCSLCFFLFCFVLFLFERAICLGICFTTKTKTQGGGFMIWLLRGFEKKKESRLFCLQLFTIGIRVICLRYFGIITCRTFHLHNCCVMHSRTTTPDSNVARECGFFLSQFALKVSLFCFFKKSNTSTPFLFR